MALYLLIVHVSRDIHYHHWPSEKLLGIIIDTRVCLWKWVVERQASLKYTLGVHTCGALTIITRTRRSSGFNGRTLRDKRLCPADLTRKFHTNYHLESTCNCHNLAGNFKVRRLTVDWCLDNCCVMWNSCGSIH